MDAIRGVDLGLVCNEILAQGSSRLQVEYLYLRILCGVVEIL